MPAWRGRSYTQSICMSLRWIAAVAVVAAGVTAVPRAQPSARVVTPRLPTDVLPVRPPDGRVSGAPGAMKITATNCATTTPLTASVRQRLVDIAVQEWAFFGYPTVDQTLNESDDDPPPIAVFRRGRPRVTPEEGARVAATIAGYWAVTPEGSWVVSRQNTAWSGPDGTSARWNSPWSAAFISWVLCEAGLGDPAVFTRAVAHHRYIDQAIRARDTGATRTAYVAFDGGEAAMAPGDLLCSGRRPAYRTLAERRRQLGQSAATHCDMIVAVDTTARRVLAIGGNVRGSVGLKIIPVEWDAARQRLRPYPPADPRIGDNPYRGVRPIFAHLKLRVDAGRADALSASATVRSFTCGARPALPAALNGLVTPPATC